MWLHVRAIVSSFNTVRVAFHLLLSKLLEANRMLLERDVVSLAKLAPIVLLVEKAEVGRGQRRQFC